MIARPIRAGLLAATLLAVTACTAGNAVELPPLPTAATPSPTVEATASPKPFPERCGDVIDTSSLVDIVAAPVRGETRRVYAGPLESADRLQRLTCSYGVRGNRPPAVQITLNEYGSASTASSRVRLTVDAAAKADQRVQSVRLGGLDGYLLTDAASVSAVIAVADRTAVVTLRRRLVPTAAEPVVLEGLVVAVLELPSEPPGGQTGT